MEPMIDVIKQQSLNITPMILECTCSIPYEELDVSEGKS
jgi:hypothetical protein